VTASDIDRNIEAEAGRLANEYAEAAQVERVEMGDRVARG